MAGRARGPIPCQSIIIGRDELGEGRVLLRDIIDLEATYAGPDGKGAPKVDALGDGEAEEETPEGEEGIAPPEGDLDDDDMENNGAVPAMEGGRTPVASASFDT